MTDDSARRLAEIKQQVGRFPFSPNDAWCAEALLWLLARLEQVERERDAARHHIEQAQKDMEPMMHNWRVLDGIMGRLMRAVILLRGTSTPRRG